MPVGTCHGFSSPHSPRIVISSSSGPARMRGSASRLQQLPTPLDCISTTLRAPPSHAPAASAMPSSSVVSVTTDMASSAWQRRISAVCPASGTCETTVTP